MYAVMPWKKTGNGSREAYRPNFPLNRFNEEFETMFNRLFMGWPASYGSYERWPYSFYPENRWGFEFEEAEKEYIVRAEVPGFEVKDFDIYFVGDVLWIKAEHKDFTPEKEKEFGFKYERHFERNVTFPAGFKADKVEAFYKNGILEVHVPKAEEVKTKKVLVKG